MTQLRALLGNNLRQYGMLLALVALVIFFQWRTDGKVLTSTNAQAILNGNSYVLIMAVGMLFVIITGQIDLAPGSVAAVVGICMALSLRGGSDWYLIIGIPVGLVVGVACGVVIARRLIRAGSSRLAAVSIGVAAGLIIGAGVAVLFSFLIHQFGIPWWGGVLVGLAVGAVIGAWQGAWLAFIGVPGFITTLAGQMLFRGLDQFIGKAESIGVPEQIQYLGGGYLPEFGPTTGLNNSTLLLGVVAAVLIIFLQLRRHARMVKLGSAAPALWTVIVRLLVIVAVIGYLTYLFGSGRTGTSFPVTGCILVVLVLIYNFISTRTPLGRSVYAVGGNRAAAALTGINTKKVYFLSMFNMSLMAAVAAIMFVGRSHSTGPSDGVGWELDAIAAVFIGGAAVSGGVGTVTGAMIGGLVMAVLNNGLQLMNVGSDMTQIIKGLVLLVAVAFDLYSKSQGHPSLIGALMRGLNPKKQMALDQAPELQPDIQAPALATSAAGTGSAGTIPPPADSAHSADKPASPGISQPPDRTGGSPGSASGPAGPSSSNPGQPV
ncbi:MAG: sugar ABC transporter permease [Propionibacteriaceae bacterium]|jgi:putative multiple sugar transport system permease protein|nr:sugar ABC transporter permease [Propionibacteriaceae bacterium]